MHSFPFRPLPRSVMPPLCPAHPGEPSQTGQSEIGDHQRRRQPDHVRSGNVDQKAGLAGRGLHRLGGLPGQHQPAQQPAAPNMVHQRVIQLLDAIAERLAEHVGAFDQGVFVQCAQHRQRRGSADRIATESAVVQARYQQRRDGLDRQASPHRQPASEVFGQRHHIRRDAVVLVGEKCSGAAHPGLHLINHQQCTMLGGDLPGCNQIAGRWDHDAGLAHDRFEHSITEWQQVRVTRSQVIQLVLLVALVYVAYPLISKVPAFFSELRTANWWWALVGLAMSALTYLGAAGALWACADELVSFKSLAIMQLANAFAATTTPAGVGGLALSTRFLQKNGLGTVRATAAVALQQTVQVITHVVLLIFFSAAASATADLAH